MRTITGAWVEEQSVEVADGSVTCWMQEVVSEQHAGPGHALVVVAGVVDEVLHQVWRCALGWAGSSALVPTARISRGRCRRWP